MTSNRPKIPAQGSRNKSTMWCLKGRKGWKIGTRRRCQTEPIILFSVSADKGTFSRWKKQSAEFGRPEKIRKKEETRSKHTQKWIGQDGAVPLPPPSHAVIGGGTNDAHRISLFSAVFHVLSCEVLVRFQSPCKQGSLNGAYSTPTVLTRTL